MTTFIAWGFDAARLGDPWPVKAAIGNSLDGAVLMARQMAGAA